MSADPDKKEPSAPPAPEAARAPDEDASDRPTVAPPFDLEAFARKSTGPTSRPVPRERAGEAPGANDGTDRADRRAQQTTITNEVELEAARAESIRLGEPTRHRTPSALSIVNARIPSTPNLPAPRSPTPTSIEAAVLEVVNSSPPPEITERTIEDPVAEMRERFSLGDYSGAMEMAELILAEDAGSLEAAECAENCRSVLEKMYAARLGPLSRRPCVDVPRTQLRWLSLDHRAGFVLSLIDGTSTVEMILDLSGMPRIDTLRILLELVQQKVVALK